MSLSVWETIAYAKDRKETLTGWKRFFSVDFEAIQTFLVLCPGEFARTYPDPRSNGILIVTRFENRWAAYPEPDSADQSADIELVEGDVQLYRLDVAALRENLRKALGVDGPSGSVHPGLECLGSCTQGPKRRRVYWVQSHDDASAIIGGQEVITRAGSNSCVILTSLGEATDRMLTAAGVSGVGLEERLKLRPGHVEGGCGIACRHLESRGMLTRDPDNLLEEASTNVFGLVVSVGRFRYLPGFNQVWIGDDLYDLRDRTKAKLCIQFMVESKAFDTGSAVHFLSEIDPYVRQHGNFPPAADIKIDHYFKDSTGQLSELRRRLIHSVRGSGRYFLKVE